MYFLIYIFIFFLNFSHLKIKCDTKKGGGVIAWMINYCLKFDNWDDYGKKTPVNADNQRYRRILYFAYSSV